MIRTLLLACLLFISLMNNSTYAADGNPSIPVDDWDHFDFVFPDSDVIFDSGGNFTYTRGLPWSIFTLVRQCTPKEIQWQNPYTGATEFGQSCNGIENQMGASRLDVQQQPWQKEFTEVLFEVVTERAPVEIYPSYPGYPGPSSQDSSFIVSVYLNFNLDNSCTSSTGFLVPTGNLTVMRFIFPRTHENRYLFDIHCNAPIHQVNYNGNSSLPLWYIQRVSMRAKSMVSNLSLEIVSLDGEQSPVSARSSQISNNDNIDLYLGELANFTLKDSNGNKLAANYQLSGLPNFDINSTPVDPNSSLYGDRLAVLFTERTLNTEQKLLPVHLGTQKIIITPVNSSYPPVTANLRIMAPPKLGSSNNQFDQHIVNQAHARGIPPQFIKGIIAQESKFNVNAYRYEPTNRDRLDFGSRGPKMTMKQYQPFIIKNPNALIGTTALLPRSTYGTIFNDGSVNYIPANYEVTQKHPLFAYDIVLVNNTSHFGFPAQRWDPSLSDNPTIISELDPGNLLFEFYLSNFRNRHQEKYNFIAQTVTASSYGLMQIMYFVAVEELEFVNQMNVGLDPTDPINGLFNPSKSIGLGSHLFFKKYLVANSPESRIQVPSFDKLVALLRRGAQQYNGLYNPRTKSDGEILRLDYNIKIWNNTKLYFPMPRT